MFCRLSSLCACARACEWESTFSSQPGQSLRLRLENTNSFRWVCLVQCCLHKLAQAFSTNWNSDKSVSQIYVGEPGLNFRQHPNHVLSTGIQWKALQFLLRGSEAAKCHDLWQHCLWTLAMISSCHHWTSRLSSSAMCGAQHHAPRQKQSVQSHSQVHGNTISSSFWRKFLAPILVSMRTKVQSDMSTCGYILGTLNLWNLNGWTEWHLFSTAWF